MDFCHTKGVYHRDLKACICFNRKDYGCFRFFSEIVLLPFFSFLQPENLLLDSQGNLKISDFGLSAQPGEVSYDRFILYPIWLK